MPRLRRLLVCLSLCLCGPSCSKERSPAPTVSPAVVEQLPERVEPRAPYIPPSVEDQRPGEVPDGVASELSSSADAGLDTRSDAGGDDVFDPEGERLNPGEMAPRDDADPVSEQCNRILDRAWAAMLPALQTLGVRPTDRVRDDFRGMRTRDSSWTADESKDFLERCRLLKTSKRACIEAAAHPVKGLYACDVLWSGKRDRRPYPPTVYAHVTLVRPALVPRSERARVISALSGSWINDDPAGESQRTWVLDDGGEGTETIVYDGGKTVRTTFTLRAKRRLRLARRDRGRRLSDLMTFWQQDADTFYASLAGYAVFEVAEPRRFVLDHFGEFVFWRGARDGQERTCEVVSATGLITRGTCRNDDEVFEARWRFSEQLKRDGSPRQVRAVWEWRGRHLLDRRLVRRGRYVRARK